MVGYGSASTSFWIFASSAASSGVPATRLTAAISETVRAGHLGSVLAWRGLAGFGAGAVAPLAVGLVLDLAAHAGAGPAAAWGLGFAALGLGGGAALLCALSLRHPR